MFLALMVITSQTVNAQTTASTKQATEKVKSCCDKSGVKCVKGKKCVGIPLSACTPEMKAKCAKEGIKCDPKDCKGSGKARCSKSKSCDPKSCSAKKGKNG